VSSLEEIRERAEKATPGPWDIDGSDNQNWGIRSVAGDQPSIAPMAGYRSKDTEADAEFIAHAREDVPALLARIEKLEAIAEAAEDAADALEKYLPLIEGHVAAPHGLSSRDARAAINHVRAALAGLGGEDT
jgi:hypothetical protein